MSLYRVTFACGLAAGYVLGTRSGRQRYDQMVKAGSAFVHHPVVQQAASTAQDLAAGAAKSTWSKTADGYSKGREYVVKRRTRTDETVFSGGGGPGDPFANGESGDVHRPFVPVNGNFGDHNLS